MSDSRPGLGKTVLVAALLTLAVTALRLYGELEGWDPKYFDTSAGGGGAMVGIGWLMPVFGFVFGWKLARNGSGPARLGKAFLMPFLGLLIGGGGAYLIAGVWKPEFWTMAIGINAIMLLGGFVAIAGWPRLGFTNLGYGLLARLPIVAITWYALDKGWKVHHTGLAPNAPTNLTMHEKFYALGGAQLGVWIGATLVFGGLAGALAAALGGKKR